MNKEEALKIMETNNKTYDLIAGDFSDTRNRVWPEMERLVRNYVKPGDKVLDLGCGNGRLARVLPKGVEYFGVDLSKGLIEQAKMNYESGIMNHEKVGFEVLDMLELNRMERGNFDIVFMFAVFNHVPSKELRLKVLEDVKKLLKPNGLLIMTNWNLWQLGKKKSIWKYGLKRDVITHWQSGDKKRAGDLYYRAFTRGDLSRLFNIVGFEVLENYYSGGERRGHWWDGNNIVSVARIN